MVTALAGAALSKLTVNPRYNPRTPCVRNIRLMDCMTPVYSGMLRCTYRVRVGPCTCKRFRTKSKGNTPVFAMTLAKTPAAASPVPNGKESHLAIVGRKPSYAVKNNPIYGTICTTAAEHPGRTRGHPLAVRSLAPTIPEIDKCVPFPVRQSVCGVDRAGMSSPLRFRRLRHLIRKIRRIAEVGTDPIVPALGLSFGMR